MVALHSVTFGYTSHPILKDISLHVREGQFVTIVGHNGSGKTTLLKLILGLIKPNSGSVSVDGKSLSAGTKRASIGYINQGSIHTRLPISVAEVVKIGLAADSRETDISESLALLGIEDLEGMQYRHLSGGQKQKVNIVRCLVGRPKLLLLDEPDAFLDQKSEIEFMEILKNLNSVRGITIIMVSHNITLVQRYASRVCRLENGSLEEHPQW